MTADLREQLESSLGDTYTLDRDSRVGDVARFYGTGDSARSPGCGEGLATECLLACRLNASSERSRLLPGFSTPTSSRFSPPVI